MENSRYNSFEDKQFKELLEECYFHSSRKYASDEIKFIARNAMLLLWDMDGISVQGIHFQNQTFAIGCSTRCLAMISIEQSLKRVRRIGI